MRSTRIAVAAEGSRISPVRLSGALLLGLLIRQEESRCLRFLGVPGGKAAVVIVGGGGGVSR